MKLRLGWIGDVIDADAGVVSDAVDAVDTVDDSDAVNKTVAVAVRNAVNEVWKSAVKLSAAAIQLSSSPSASHSTHPQGSCRRTAPRAIYPFSPPPEARQKKRKRKV